MIDEVKNFFFFFFLDLGRLGLAGCSQPNVTDSDQGSVAGMPLMEAILKRMKKVVVFVGLG